MITDIHITDWSAYSALGSHPEVVWRNYLQKKHFFQFREDWLSELGTEGEEVLQKLKNENLKFKNLDRSTLLAMAVSRNLKGIEKHCGLSIGSSRGATHQFEAFYDDFLINGATSPLASPTTTLGNLSSWVAQDLGIRGFSMSHSVTCSTALHSIANACAWLKAGFSTNFIAGGTEAPLTNFTVAQMKAMRIYADAVPANFPCKSYDFGKSSNSMILGEGAALFHLSTLEKPLAKIRSIGFASESIQHGSSISEDGQSLRLAMEMALDGLDPSIVDVIVMHAPGTIKGDLAEKNAIEAVFKNNLPFLTGNKWKIGHTLGASGALSMEFALLMMQHQTFINLPWEEEFIIQRPINNILINAVGFGGNAVSVLLSHES